MFLRQRKMNPVLRLATEAGTKFLKEENTGLVGGCPDGKRAITTAVVGIESAGESC